MIRNIARWASALIFTLSPAIQVNAQFTWKNPLPQGNDLYAAFFKDDSTGFVAGNVGTVMKTTDGGYNWQITNLTEHRKYTLFVAICFPAQDTGFAADEYGFVYRTYNDGVTWDTTYYEDYEYIYDAFFTDTKHGFMTCSYGVILSTSDGGDTWQRYTHPSEAALSSICFPSHDIGYIAGSFGLILKTTDGGQTWIEKNLDSTLYLTDIRFITDSSGIATSNEGKALRTTNGGSTWTPVLFGDTVSLFSVGFFNKDTILVSGHASSTTMMIGWPRVFRSTDGGITFEILESSDQFYGMTRFYCLPSGTAYGVDGYGFLAKSIDFGETWEMLFSNLLYIDYFGGDINALDFPSGEVGYAVAGGVESPFGSVLKTTDAGVTWFLLDSIFPWTNFKAVEFTTDQKGCIGSQDMYCTNDGGQHWIKRFTGDYTHRIRSISFASVTHGIAVGYNGLFIRTTDQGQSWAYVSGVPAVNYGAVEFGDDSTGYVTGDGVMLKTVDAGAIWTELTIPVPVTSLSFVNASTGYGIGPKGKIVKTTDGGQSWDALDSQVNDNLYAIDFYDADTGFTAGGTFVITSVVMKTTDGGYSWNPVYIPTYYPMQDIEVTPYYSVFTGGWAGFLFGAENGGYTGIQENTLTDCPTISWAYPNPFNDQTTIEFSLSSPSRVSLMVTDLYGKKKIQLMDEKLTAGTFRIPFSSAGLQPGSYVYRLSVGNLTETGKLIIIR